MQRGTSRIRPGCCLTTCLFLLITPLLCLGFTFIAYLVIPPAPVDIVILGVDARNNENYATRTDAIMLLGISPKNLNVSLLSIPRDVFLEVPGYGEQRANTINVLGEQEITGGGPTLITKAIQESFGVGVDRYVRLNFDGFIDLVNAVGGIEVDVPKLIIDYEYPTTDGGTTTIRFEPGQQHMNGEQALAYARTRHQDDDFQRAARQQQIVNALIGKLTDPRQIFNYPTVLQILTSNADSNLSNWDMIRYSPALLMGWPSRDTLVLDRELLTAMQGSNYTYWVPNYDLVQKWMDSRFD